MTRWEWVLLALVLIAAVSLRGYRLHQPVMWCDEAESSINALTILQHGYPTDTYLGLPIFENVLSEPWPDHPEYEFRDSSYSRKGLAIYHAWLPLYSIAGSLKAFGIEPDVADGALRPRHDVEEIHRRNIAARLPAVIFGALFLIVVFAMARDIFGREASWVALLGASVFVPLVHIARQARYYSLTVLFSTLCCWMIWRMYQRGRWSDFILGALAFAALFHTHALTFVTSGVVMAVMSLFMIRRPGGFARLCAFGGIVIALTLPWMIATGFFEAARAVPKARAMLQWIDFVQWPLGRWPVTLLLTAGPVLVLVIHHFRRVIPQRIVDAFHGSRGPLLFVALWAALSYVGFLLLIPAASLAFQRSWLPGVGPGIVFGAVFFCCLTRFLPRAMSIPVASLLFVLYVAQAIQTDYTWTRANNAFSERRIAFVIEEMRGWDLRPNTRLYATPNEHLTLTFYTGLPVQSIAPVRRSFLETYPHDIVLIETFLRLLPIERQWVQNLAAARGRKLDDREADALAYQLSLAGIADYQRDHVARVWPDLANLPDFARDAFQLQRDYTRYRLRTTENPIGENPAVFRGFEYRDYASWWQTFFYRFVDPASRSHENVNYARRMRNAHLEVLPSMWCVYFSPPPSSARSSETIATPYQPPHIEGRHDASAPWIN
jgi:hypothetical protein